MLTVLTGLTSACHNNTTSKKAIDSVSKSVVTSIQSTRECYSAIQNKDTATLAMTLSGTNVTGTLSYNLFEKDKNNGTIAGTIKGDTILADYTFNSEGTQSVRQVVFLKKGNQLLEGFGDVEEKNGKTSFKDSKTLKFEQQMVFDKTDCKN